MEIISFEFSWQFWHWRRPYTTTSPLSFYVPTYTSLRWLIGAILWYEKDIFNEELNKLNFWMEVMCSIQKKMFWTNYHNTKKYNFDEYIQVKRECIINPKYIIYISNNWFKDWDLLKQHLKEKQFAYTTCLWVAEFIWNIDNVYIWNGNVVEKWSNVSMNTIISSSLSQKIDYTFNSIIRIDELPHSMNNKRELLKQEKIIHSCNQNPILIKEIWEYINFNNKNIVLC